MKPIQTTYKKIRFRSRLEARWAVFMDHLGVKYVYEAEGFDLGGILYLPDFWLPDLDCYLEIKPLPPTEQEEEKASRLAAESGKRVFILFEFPRNPYTDKGPSESGYLYSGNADDAVWDNQQWWCECPKCGMIDIQYFGRADRIGCDCRKSAHGDKGYNSDSDRLLDAYETAEVYKFY